MKGKILACDYIYAPVTTKARKKTKVNILFVLESPGGLSRRGCGGSAPVVPELTTAVTWRLLTLASSIRLWPLNSRFSRQPWKVLAEVWGPGLGPVPTLSCVWRKHTFFSWAARRRRLARRVLLHLLHVPVAELCGQADLLRVFVHRHVEVEAPPLHRQTVPVLIVQQAAERGQTSGLGRGGGACEDTPATEQ